MLQCSLLILTSNSEDPNPLRLVIVLLPAPMRAVFPCRLSPSSCACTPASSHTSLLSRVCAPCPPPVGGGGAQTRRSKAKHSDNEEGHRGPQTLIVHQRHRHRHYVGLAFSYRSLSCWFLDNCGRNAIIKYSKEKCSIYDPFVRSHIMRKREIQVSTY